MGYKVNFLDNEQIAALDLNSISERLGGGVLDFLDDTLYGVTDLNKISQNLIGRGVSEGCALSVSAAGVTIGPGSAFMADGKRVEVDTDGVTLAYKSGADNYVWFDGDAVTGFVTPRCTTTVPSGTNFVLLGQISATGKIVGYQDKAIMKHAFLGTNKAEEHTVVLSATDAVMVQEQEVLFKEISLQNSGYRRLVVTGVGPEAQCNLVNGTIDLTTGETKGLFAHSLRRTLFLDQYLYALTSDNSAGTLMVCLSSSGSENYRTFFRFSLGQDNVLRIYRCVYRALDRGGLYGNYGVVLTLKLC